MAINDAEVKLIFDTLEKTKVFFLEAIAYRSHPQTLELKKLISNNAIGKIEKIEASFGFSVKKLLKFVPNHRLFNKKLGGGSILDIGCYPVSFGLLVANILKNDDLIPEYQLTENKVKINFRGTDDEAYTKIKFKDLFFIEANISIKKKLDNETTIFGSQGKIRVPNPWLPSTKSFIEVFNEKKIYKNEIFSKYSIYANTIKKASDAIEEKRLECEHPNFTWQESKENIKILTQWKNFESRS